MPRIAITMRLNEDDAERFKTLAQQNGISQADFLVQLMNRYGIAERGQMSQEWQNNIIIYLYIRIWDALCPTKKPEDRTLKYEFPGQAVYTPQSFFTRPAKEVESLLKKDFDFAVPLDSYQFSHVVYLFRDDKAKKYLANEIMLLSQQNNGLMDNYFSLSRCRHVDSFKDFCEKFGRYCVPANITGVQHAMAEEIGDDYTQFDQFF